MFALKALNLTLLPLSWLYGFFTTVRNFLYDVRIFRATAVAVPVICVGNLTAGGSGKTPIVEHVVGMLLPRGVRVGVVSRGYRRMTRGTVVVSDGRTVHATVASGGDEPVQIARKFPSACVVVDENRARGATVAIRECGAEVIVLDDGFQHRSLKRDLDIVVVDADNPPQETWFLPAGMRREPLSALKRAGAIIISRWSDEKGPRVGSFVGHRTDAPQFKARFSAKSLVRVGGGARRPVENARGLSCVAFCGIARPLGFKSTLEHLGVHLKTIRFFPDHHSYTREELEDLESTLAGAQAECLITTEKDAVRLADGAKDFLARCPVYYVEIETRISDDEEFSRLILGTIRA